MADHTPTTDHVRKLYTLAYAWRGYDDVDAGESDLSSNRHDQRAEFDRWLAAHDAEIAREAEARALREAADQLTEIADDYDTCSELHAALRECDLDTAHWLRARADRNDSEGAS